MARMDRHPWLRRLGIAAAIGCTALYALIGFGVLSVGESTAEPAGGAPADLLGFGLLMAGFSAATALALWRLRSRLWLGIVAGVQLVPLLGYVAAAGVREPPFELWGVLIKVGQAVVFAAAAVLALTATRTPDAEGSPSPSTTLKGHVA